jgi:hypothetical protein
MEHALLTPVCSAVHETAKALLAMKQQCTEPMSPEQSPADRLKYIGLYNQLVCTLAIMQSPAIPQAAAMDYALQQAPAGKRKRSSSGSVSSQLAP